VATGVGGAAVVAFYLMRQGAGSDALASSVGERFSGLASLYHVFSWCVDLVSRMVGSIPPLWLYGGLAFVALMYAAFFGLGAAAYRALYRNN